MIALPPRQLALALEHWESFAREDFLRGPGNAAALTLIERWPDWPARAVAIVGPEGSGKSHLAAVWAAAAGARTVSARALREADVPAALATGALVVEDLVPGDVEERALFHLLNLVREERAFVLLTARQPLPTMSMAVADLTSRLRALPAATLSAPDDALLRALIVKQMSDRQLSVDQDLVAYLSAHIERSYAAARRAVAQLDEEAMRRKRPVTRALAAELFRPPRA